MAVDLSSLSNITTTATNLGGVVLVTPNAKKGYQPQAKPNADGTPNTSSPTDPSLLFHYEGENTFTIESDITDHYVEDNTAIQNQIALKPEIITVHGFIGELNNVPPPGLDLVKTAAEKLTFIGAYVPVVSETALIAYNEALLAYQVAKTIATSAVSAWNTITGQQVQNLQQKMFNQFYGYWMNRRLFTIQTPWVQMSDMAILRLRAIQDAETRVITDFEITFKKIRTAQTSVVFGISQILGGRAALQAANEVNTGAQTPVNDIGLMDGLTSATGVA